jgi:hypothetical protein
MAAIRAVAGPDPHNESGESVLAMIQSEHQLSRDPGSADAEWMGRLLAELFAVNWTDLPSGVARSYERLVRQFAQKGPSIAAKPPLLFRYVNGPGIFGQIRKALETAGSTAFAEELNRLITTAHNGSGRTWKDVLTFIQEDPVWTAIPHDRVRLSGHHSTFVTFDLDGSSKPLQGSAAKMHAALALWKPVNACFVELRYRPEPSEVLRFPTLADAGWFRFFWSAPSGEPYGWTRPHDVTLGPRPEAVHDDPAPTLARIERPMDIQVLPP